MKKTVLLSLTIACCTAVSAQQTLTLQQLTDSALQHNVALRSARHDVEAAREQRREAFTKYFPNVSATAMTFNANRGMAKMNVDPQELIPASLGATLSQLMPAEALAGLASPISMSMMKNGTIASLMAMQPVFAGGQIVNGNRLARVGEDVSLLQMDLKENEVERQVAEYYWQLVCLQEKMNTVHAADSLLADIYKDVEVAVKAGVTLRNDLLQVQLRQNDMKSQQLKLENGIGIIRLLLAQYCGLRSDAFAVAQASGEADAPTLSQGSVSVLPEYQLLEKQVEVSRLQKKMAVGQQLPSVAVGAGYNYHNLLDNDRTFAMVFATVSVPISGWWGGSHSIKRSKIAVRKAEEQLEDNAQLLSIRMQKATNDVAEARQQLLLARQGMEKAEENLRISRNRYQAGTSTMNALLEAQLLSQQARDKHTDAQAQLQLSLLDYRQAVGQ